jgi:hypothetical protein
VATLQIALLGFGAVIFVVQSLSLMRLRRGWGPMSFRVTIFGIAIVATLFLAVSDIDSEKLAPAYGLIGVIAGYAAGKEAKREQ